MENYLSLCTSEHKDRLYCKLDGIASHFPFFNTLSFLKMPLDINSYYDMYVQLSTRYDICKITGIPQKSPMTGARRSNANLLELPTYEITLDLDSIKAPTIDVQKHDHLTLDHIQLDTENFIRQYLPPEFHGVSYIIRLSSSFIIKDGLKVHLHFLSSEPLYPGDIRNWLISKKIPVDPSIYRLSQPIFTSSPLWNKTEDPLSNHPALQSRIILIRKSQDLLPSAWFPLSTTAPQEARVNMIRELPESNDLPGKAGAFCRNVFLDDVLTQLGYIQEVEGRWLSPTSTTGTAGLMTFRNGYCYTHHSDDPFTEINQKLYGGIKSSLNAYDLARGYSSLYGAEALSWFNNALKSACESDGIYTTNNQSEMQNRTQWLDETIGYSGLNQPIIDSILDDLVSEYVSPLVRKEIFKDIASKTKKNVSIGDLTKELKTRLKGDIPEDLVQMDIEADPQQQTDLFLAQDILFPAGNSATANFYAFMPETRLWRRLHSSTTDDFIGRTLNSMLPDKLFFPQPALKILKVDVRKATALAKPLFESGDNWGFKDGQYGLNTTTWNTLDWTPEKAIFPLKKEDKVIRELPITYPQYLERTNPEMYLQYLMSTFDKDPDSLQLFLEITAYILESSYCYPKFFIFEGGPGTGKSVAANILTAMVGDSMTVLSLKDFDYTFGMESLIDKKLILIHEPRGIDSRKKAAVLEALLSITGNDTQSINQKGIKATRQKLPGKIVMITNQAPIFKDETGAIRDRTVFLRFNNRIRGTESEKFEIDKHIAKHELPAVVGTAINKLKQLREQKGFRLPQSGKDALASVDAMGAPLRTFINSNFLFIDEASHNMQWVPIKEFKQLFHLYLQQQGMEPEDDKHLTRLTHIRQMKAINNIIEKKGVRFPEGIKNVIRPLVYKDEQGLKFSLQS